MSQSGCGAHGSQDVFEAPFAMAFQPIVDVRAGAIHAYEALVRGPSGEAADTVLGQLTPSNRYAFDRASRIAAIETAAELGLGGEGPLLSMNFFPNAIADPAACARGATAAARRTGIPLDRLVFEFSEGEPIEHGHLSRILAVNKTLGVRTAIDDFGAGYSGLTLLAKFQPDLVKLDMELVRDIDAMKVKQVLVAAMVKACGEIGVEVVAEGIETPAECAVLREMGVKLQQGFLFARPALRSLPQPAWPEVRSAIAA